MAVKEIAQIYSSGVLDIAYSGTVSNVSPNDPTLPVYVTYDAGQYLNNKCIITLTEV